MNKLNSSERMIAHNVFYALQRKENVTFDEIQKATYYDIVSSRRIMKVVNNNVVRYNKMSATSRQYQFEMSYSL